jgi:hypothetical protein
MPRIKSEPKKKTVSFEASTRKKSKRKTDPFRKLFVKPDLKPDLKLSTNTGIVKSQRKTNAKLKLMK